MKQIKIGLVSGILHPKYGGPPSVIQAHQRGLVGYADTEVFGVSDPGDEEEIGRLYPNCQLFQAGFPKRWFRGKGLRKALKREAPRFDVLHAHMFWDHAVFATWDAARKARKPFIVTPHGSILNVWRWKPFHKMSYRKFVLDPILKSCAFVHALNKREEEGCRDFGVTCPVRVIPNGLPAAAFSKKRNPQAAWEKWPILKQRRIMLFMGRLAPLKGLDMLPQAWKRCLSATQDKDWILVIAGPDYRGFEAKIKDMIADLGMRDRIIMTGAVSGEMKESLLASAEAFVLPSYTEGFSVAMLEAIAASLPCLFTTECHFSELEISGGGIEIEPKLGSLVEGLVRMITLQPEVLSMMGKRANELGLRKYTLETVRGQLMEMYREACGNISRAGDGDQ